MKAIRRAAVVLLLGIITLGLAESVPVATNSTPTTIALEWLGVVDGKKYDDAWTFTSPEFREDMTMQKWVSVLTWARDYEPEKNSRAVDSVTESSTLHDYPKTGMYATVDVTTKSKAKDTWRELVILVQTNREWKIIGHSFYKE